MSFPPKEIADTLDADLQPEFKRLTKVQGVAWPTVATWLLMTVIYVASTWAAVIGQIPLWVGMLINGGVGYLTFTVVHDSLHRSVAANARLNDFIGQCAVYMITPYVHLKLFRWGHIQHHRFTSEPKDPDYILHGPTWTLPFRWMAIDALYLRHVIIHGDRISKPYLIASIKMAALVFTTIAVLSYFGYGMEVLMLWFIPSRIIFLTLGFSFFWLPHVPHDTEQKDNFTKATTLRLGWEWLMAPLLQNHHVHLIHHLYPSTPFYNNVKVYKLIEPELRRRDLAIQHGFAIQPTIYAPGTGKA